MTIIIEKATIKMKKLLKYILLLIYVALMPACGEDSGLDGVFANKPFALVTAADGGRTSISAVIDDGKRTIRLTFDKKRDVDAVELTFQLNPGYAMVSPKEPETTMDLTQPRTCRASDHPVCSRRAASRSARRPRARSRGTRADRRRPPRGYRRRCASPFRARA